MLTTSTKDRVIKMKSSVDVAYKAVNYDSVMTSDNRRDFAVLSPTSLQPCLYLNFTPDAKHLATPPVIHNCSKV